MENKPEIERDLLVGIDPGLTGAIAFYSPYCKSLVSVHDMPITHLNGKKAVDAWALADLIEQKRSRILFAMVELVSAMTYMDKSGNIRGQGAASSFNFGKSTGIIHGVLAAKSIPQYQVHSSVWKSQMNLSSRKMDSIEKVRQLFPSSAYHFNLAKHDGRAEALLLAVFAERQLKK